MSTAEHRPSATNDLGERSPAAAGDAGAAAGGGGAPLVTGSDGLLEEWQRIQGRFVDDPRAAVGEAGALVEEVLGRLRGSFDEERSRLNAEWDAGGEPSTEELRVAMRRYRDFFERLLAA